MPCLAALVSGDSWSWTRRHGMSRPHLSAPSAADKGEEARSARAGVRSSRPGECPAIWSLKAAASAFHTVCDHVQLCVRAASATVMQSQSTLLVVRLVVRGSDTRWPLHICCLPFTGDWARFTVWPAGPVLDTYQCRDHVSVANRRNFSYTNVCVFTMVDRPTILWLGP